MRPKLGSFSRYRPRVLTLVFLAGIAATIVLANLSEEFSDRKLDPQTPRFPPLPAELEFDLGEPLAKAPFSSLRNMSYGWPLVWRQYVVAYALSGFVAIGEYHSAGRLAGNMAIWLALLAIPAGFCEWLLRRYQPRLRFSLRSMLVVVSLAAALCSWFAVARNRANAQDALFAARIAPGDKFWVESWGPKWFEVIGADRYCRRIVGTSFGVDGYNDEDQRKSQKMLALLKELPDLEYLSLRAGQLSPETSGALGELRQLKTLQIEIGMLTPDTGRPLARALCGLRRLQVLSIHSRTFYTNDHISREKPAPEGVLGHLEILNLSGRTIACEDLASLAGLKSVKSLTLGGLFGRRGPLNDDRSLLANLPAKTHFKSLDLSGSQIFDDLEHVATMPQLKSLSLIAANFSAAGLTQLAPLESLEELAIDDDLLSSRGCEAILKFKRLKKLHFGFVDEELLGLSPKELRDEASILPEDEAEDADWLRALADLRDARPDLAIDGGVKLRDWSEHELAPKCDMMPKSFPPEIFREAVRVWKEQQAAMAANQNAAVQPAP